jgi:WD40 repeat protein
MTIFRPGLVFLACGVCLGCGLGANTADGGEAGIAAPAVRPRFTDRYGDPLPPFAVIRFGTVRLRLKDADPYAKFVFAAAPDGKTLFVYEGAGITLWDVPTGKASRHLAKVPWQVRDAAFFPDSRRIALGTWEKTVHVVDLSTGKELHCLRGHQKEIWQVAVSPDGRCIASATLDCTVYVWDAATGRLLRRLGRCGDLMKSFTFSPDGRSLAFSDGDDLSAWDTASGERTWRVALGTHSVCDVAFSPRGDTIACAGPNNTVRLWDARTGVERRRFTGHRDEVTSVAFSPDGRSLASTGNDGSLRLWDVSTGAERGRVTADTSGTIAFYSPGGVLATINVDDAIQLWDANTLKEREPWVGHHRAIYRLAFSPDGRLLATGGFGGTVRQWDLRTGGEVRRISAPRLASVHAFSPSWDALAFASGPRVIVRDPSTSRTRREFTAHGGDVQGLVFYPDGKSLASVSDAPTVQAWDVRTGEELWRWRGEARFQKTLAVSPDGKRLAVRVYDRPHGVDVAHLLDARTGECLRSLSIPPDRGGYLSFLPDGDTLATVSHDDWAIEQWSLSTAEMRSRKLQGQDDNITASAFSPDFKLAATGGLRETRVWEVATGQEVLRLAGHRGYVNSVAFSPDGLTLATGSSDTTALLWDLVGRFDHRYRPTAPLSPEDLEGLWQKLASGRAAEAYRAAWALAAVPEQSVPFLKAHLSPVPVIEPEQFARLLRDLDDPSFEVREKATHHLVRFGDAVSQRLRGLLQQKGLSVEVRRRIELVLSMKEDAGARLRLHRAVTCLQAMCHPAADALLKSLSEGEPHAALTQDARASWRRRAASPGRP